LFGILDQKPRVRLIATRKSGLAAVYTLTRESSSGKFSASAHSNLLEGVADPLPVGSFVLDAKTGARCVADRARFASALGDNSSGKGLDVFWISVGSKGMKSVFNVDGERLARADWSSKAGHVETVQIVQRHSGCPLSSVVNQSEADAIRDACILAAFTNRKELLVYSIPYFELMHTFTMARFSTG
jgi:syntaxin-binding protein 5